MTLTVCDTTLRDGSHAVGHSFSASDVAATARALDRAGVDIIEVSHGDGLGGSSLTYGRSAQDELELIVAAAEQLSRARLAVLLLPGVGTRADLEQALDRGASVVRVATHVTEADIADQHIAMARKADALVVGFLMMAHSAEPDVLAAQGRRMAEAGAHVVYVTDSAGALVPDGVRARVDALRSIEGIEVGFHGHNNLGLGVANTLVAVEQGATYVDGTLCGLGAGAGNAQLEPLVAVLERAGHETGVDLFAVCDAARDIVTPLMRGPQIIDDRTLVQGYAGVYSSFLLHAQRAAARYDVDPRELLLEVGRRKAVGGQEDMLLDVAIELAGR